MVVVMVAKYRPKQPVAMVVVVSMMPVMPVMMSGDDDCRLRLHVDGSGLSVHGSRLRLHVDLRGRRLRIHGSVRSRLICHASQQ